MHLSYNDGLGALTVSSLAHHRGKDATCTRCVRQWMALIEQTVNKLLFEVSAGLSNLGQHQNTVKKHTRASVYAKLCLTSGKMAVNLNSLLLHSLLGGVAQNSGSRPCFKRIKHRITSLINVTQILTPLKVTSHKLSGRVSIQHASLMKTRTCPLP